MVKAKNSMTISRKSIFLMISVISLQFVFLYIFYSKNYFFLFDDFSIIELAQNKSIHEILSSPLIGFYRPVVFLCMKLQASFFGWTCPQFYSAVSIVVHCLNAAILGLILMRLKFSSHAVFLSSIIFLYSPWATEAFFWMSAQYDLLSTLFMLLSVYFYIRHIQKPKRPFLLFSVVMFLLATFSKENSIVFPAVIPAVNAFYYRKFWARRSWIQFLPFLGAAIFYCFIRMSVFNLTRTAYGDITSLYVIKDIIPNIAKYLSTFLLLHEKIFQDFRLLGFLYGFMAAAGMAFAFVKRYLHALSLLVLFLISLTPVLWYSTRPDTTGAGRMLYAPAVFLCVLVGIGIQNLVESTSSRRLCKIKPLFQTAVTVGIATCLLSTSFQAVMWKSCASISRNTLHYVIKVAHRTDKNIHIENLPVLFVEGPFILKSYAFPIFAEGKYGIRLSKIRSHWVYLSYRNKDFVQNVGRDPFSEYWKEPGECVEEFTIVLPLSSFR